MKRRRQASAAGAEAAEETDAAAAGAGTAGDIAADSIAADSRGGYRGTAPGGSECCTCSWARANGPAEAYGSSRPAAEWAVHEVLAS